MRKKLQELADEVGYHEQMADQILWSIRKMNPTRKEIKELAGEGIFL